MKKEIEVLVSVRTTKNVAVAALANLTPLGVKATHDTYYIDPLRQTLKPEPSGRLRECCRLREKAGRTQLAYKVDHFGPGDVWEYSDEHEVDVSSAEIARSILAHLGLEPLVEIVSEKHVYDAGPYEVVLEDVRDLGLFLEVEVKEPVDDADVAAERERIWTFIRGLGLAVGEELNAGKPELLLTKRRGA